MHLRKFVQTISLLCCAAFTAATGSAYAAADGPYAVIDKWVIGGQGGWDYLLADSSMHVLYLTHGTRVEVVDTTTGKAIGAITDLKGTHGIALDTDGKYGYISDGGANAVIVFDRKTYAKVQSIATGTNPDGITFEPVTKTVWAFNGRSNDVSVIDAATMKVTGTIKLSGKPEFPAADGKGIVFVNIETKNSIARLDAKTLKQTAEWPLAGCESPSGLAIDRAGRRLFSVCDGKKMAVISADTGMVIKMADIGDGPDAAGFDPKNQVAFSSNSDGSLSVIDAKGSDYKLIQSVATPKRARTMSFDPGTGRIYLLAAEYGPAPAATPAMPKPRPTVVPGTYSVIVVGKK
jgi:YVTN family beta-propeller protein